MLFGMCSYSIPMELSLYVMAASTSITVQIILIVARYTWNYRPFAIAIIIAACAWLVNIFLIVLEKISDWYTVEKFFDST